jgi:KaiC/GvpD/RAD55 family RecA-like ATPase
MNQKKELLLLQTILDDNSWLEEVSLSANMFKVYPEVAQFIFNKYADNKEVSFADVMFNFENIQLGSEVVADFAGIAEDFISEYRRDEEVLYLKATLDMIEKGSGVEEARIALEKKQVELDGGFNTDVTYRYSQFRTYIDDLNNNYTIREEGGVVMTELNKFNKIMGGYREGRFNVIAARPGMGKTSLMIQEAYDLVRQGVPVLFYSLEMTATELIAKLANIATGISYKRQISGEMSKDELEFLVKFSEELYELPLFIVDNKNKWYQIKDDVQRKIRKYGIKVVVFDYVQLINMPGANTLEQISQLSTEIKRLALNNKICCVGISQMSRDSDKGGRSFPKSSDLRGSGQLEQDADFIAFPWRYEAIDILEDPATGESLVNRTDIYITKNRHGDAFKKIPCDYDFQRSRIQEIN